MTTAALTYGGRTRVERDGCGRSLRGNVTAESCSDCGDSRCTACMKSALPLPKNDVPGLAHDHYICRYCADVRAIDLDIYCFACQANRSDMDEWRIDARTAVCCA